MKTTKNLAEVIRRKLASDPQLAAAVDRERAVMRDEQKAWDIGEKKSDGS